MHYTHALSPFRLSEELVKASTEAAEGAAARARLAQQEGVLHALHLKLATATELLGETRTLPA